MLSRMCEWSTRMGLIMILILYIQIHQILATIDVNLNELEYLAARLNPFECRRLIVALHYTSYELPNNLQAAERNVDDDIPCIRHLLHWNSAPAEGKGATHEVLSHRLRQINRGDLADWLGKSAFKQLGKDLDRAMVKPFEEFGKEETELPYPITLEPLKKQEKDDLWQQVDVILIAILLGLLGTFVTLICAMVCQKIRQHFRKTKYTKLRQEEHRSEKEGVTKKKIKSKYPAKGSSNEATSYVRVEDSTDTDFD